MAQKRDKQVTKLITIPSTFGAKTKADTLGGLKHLLVLDQQTGRLNLSPLANEGALANLANYQKKEEKPKGARYDSLQVRIKNNLLDSKVTPKKSKAAPNFLLLTDRKGREYYTSLNPATYASLRDGIPKETVQRLISDHAQFETSPKAKGGPPKKFSPAAQKGKLRLTLPTIPTR